MDEEWSAGEGFLESFESFSGSRCPGQRLVFVLQEVGEWAGDDDVVMYESSVEV